MKNSPFFSLLLLGSQIIAACDCSEIAELEMIQEKNYFKNKEESVCVCVASAR